MGVGFRRVFDLAGRTAFILLWVGFMALFRGFSDIVLAFNMLAAGKSSDGGLDRPSVTTSPDVAGADYVDHFAWVALDEAGDPVGEASYFRTPDGTDAEVSFWLPDDFQERGLGTLLMGALAVAARRNGVIRFVADVLGDNARARAMLDRAGARWTPEGPGVVHAVAAVPDPSRFGIPPQTAVALAALVDAVVVCGSRWTSSRPPPSGV